MTGSSASAYITMAKAVERPSLSTTGNMRMRGVLVVFAIEPRDGVEVGELPEEHDGEQHQRFAVEPAANGRPAQHRRHGAGKRAQKGADGVHALHRRVHHQIADGGERCQRGGQPVGRDARGTTTPPIVMPKATIEACTRLMLPVTSGRSAVRRISASMSRSMTSLMRGRAAADQADADQRVQQRPRQRQARRTWRPRSTRPPRQSSRSAW